MIFWLHFSSPSSPYSYSLILILFTFPYYSLNIIHFLFAISLLFSYSYAYSLHFSLFNESLFQHLKMDTNESDQFEFGYTSWEVNIINGDLYATQKHV